MIVVDRVYTVDCAKHYVEPLLAAHYEELCTDKSMVLSPDWGKYNALYDSDSLVMQFVFDGNLCVGYSICFLSPHAHYKDTTIAWNDLLFLHKDYRGGSAGSRLMKATVLACKEAGATKLLWHAKPGTTLDAVLAKREKLFEKVYAQAL